jgi:RES domain-containing protein
MARFVATAWVTAPARSNLRPTDLITRTGNRWSRPGEATIYLASDPGVALAEFGRHWPDELEATCIWAVDLRLRAAVDLRDGERLGEFGLSDDPAWIRDADRCAEVARAVRASPRNDGMIVPSAAFLDDPDRWNVVVFVDRLELPLASVVLREAEVSIVPLGLPAARHDLDRLVAEP